MSEKELEHVEAYSDLEELYRKSREEALEHEMPNLWDRIEREIEKENVNDGDKVLPMPKNKKNKYWKPAIITVLSAAAACAIVITVIRPGQTMDSNSSMMDNSFGAVAESEESVQNWDAMDESSTESKGECSVEEEPGLQDDEKYGFEKKKQGILLMETDEYSNEMKEITWGEINSYTQVLLLEEWEAAKSYQYYVDGEKELFVKTDTEFYRLVLD